MKLSGYEINAVVEICIENEYKRLKPILDKKEAEAKAAASKRAKELMKIWNTIPNDLKEIMYNVKKLSESEIISRIAKKDFPEAAEVNRESIKAKVIVTSIDCENMNHLAKKLNIKI